MAQFIASPAIVTQSTSTLDGASAVYGLSTAFVVAEDLRDPTICRLLGAFSRLPYSALQL